MRLPLLTATLLLCAILGLASADPYVQYRENATVSFVPYSGFFDHSNQFAFLYSTQNQWQEQPIMIAKLNSTSLEVLDSIQVDGMTGFRSDLYASKGWLLAWAGYYLHKFNASDLASGPIDTLDLSANMSRSIGNVVIDEARQLAFVVNYYDGFLAIVDVTTLTVKSLFNFTTEFNIQNEAGAYPMVYDASRQVLWIGVDCAYGVPSYIWQVNMENVDAPYVMTKTAFGGDTCFEGEPVIDPEGTGIVWFNDDDTNNVYGIRPDGSWGPDLFLPFPLYARSVGVDSARKQAFYVSDYWCCGERNHIYRTCFNDRSQTYTATSMGVSFDIYSAVYDSTSETLFVFTDNVILAYSVSGTDCPQSYSAPSAASTPMSTFYSLLVSATYA